MHQTNGTRGEHESFQVQTTHQDIDTFVETTENVLFRHFTVLKHEFASVRAAHAELVELLSGLEALHALLNQEGRDAVRTLASVSLGVDYQHIGVGAVSDPHLVAVEHVFVACAGTLDLVARVFES